MPSDALQGVVLAAVARGPSPPADRVAVICCVDDSYGASLSGVFRGGLRDRHRHRHRGVAVPSWRLQLHRRHRPMPWAQDPRHVLLIAFPPRGAQILRDWRDSGLRPDLAWLATDGLCGMTSSRRRGPQGRPRHHRHRAAPSPGPTTPPSRRATGRPSGRGAGIFTSNQYDAMILIALGIQRRGPAPAPARSGRHPEAARAPGSMVAPMT